MKKNFEKYANFYDLFNIEKDYSKEINYVVKLLKLKNNKKLRILDIGCGTGLHAIQLAKMGFEVFGIDSSKNMIKIAKLNALKMLKPNERNNVKFLCKKIQNFESNKKFDIALSLFHVFSYQITLHRQKLFVNKVHKILKKDGVFIFDFWYTPSVNHLKSMQRSKIIIFEDKIIERISIPQIKSRDRIDVTFKISASELASRNKTKVTEKHKMKSFQLSEVKNLSKDIFDNIYFYEWLKLSPPNKKNWSAVVKMRRS